MALFVSQIRNEYAGQRLLESEADADPIKMFDLWLQAAIDSGLLEPNAMTLATATADGRPSARMMLLKGITKGCFDFFSNYESRKAQELTENPWAALTFWWDALGRQVRVEGTVTKMPAAESDFYYDNRPKGSQLGAWVSRQSKVISGRGALQKRLLELEAEYVKDDPDRPPFWGGYRLTPTVIEFWQGGPHRLHDRLRYTLQAGGDWTIDRLSP